MSANLDRIDLNSDAVSVESENDAMGPNLSEPTDRVDLPDAKTLTEPSQVPEVGEYGGGRGADGSCGKGFERKTEAVGHGIGIDLDGKFGSLDGGQDTAADSGKAGQNGLSRVEREVEEASCVGGSSNSLHGYASQVQNASCSGSSLGVVNVEVKSAYGNDFLPRSNVDSGVLQENDINTSNELNLVVDLKSFRTADAGDMKAKTTVSEQEFCVPDLVWGKVWSHPWWPGQIFDPSAASKKAKKYFKRGRHLIAYFGDQSFAWNEDSMIKPFRTHFSQMEKQSNSEDFIYAIDCALDELCRRVELGLACPCVPEYSKIKSQMIVNAGIREECSRKDDSDNFSSATFFEPCALVEFIKALSQQLPFGKVERLEIVTAQAQLLAFSRWKGYSDLPQFQMLGALLESDEEISLPEMKHDNGVNENVAMEDKIDGQVSSEKDRGSSSRKRKHNSGDSSHPSKKEKSLAELMLEKRSSLSNGKCGLDSKDTIKPISSSSGRKRTAVDSVSDESAAKLSKSPPAVEKNSSQPKKTYRVGDSILRATQMSDLTPILKSVSATSQKPAAKNKGKPIKSQEIP
uniref:Uncharacterized protein MANES_08G003300 n=1 Tax=Rhizophora mucronata TaxID=61149 RepID=A0A2P2JKM7_RHIMU